MQREKVEAEQQIEQSRAAQRRVEAKDPEVRRMGGLLEFYSERNGFADAFDQMIKERGRRHHAAGS